MDYQLGPGPLQVDQNTIDEKIKGDIGIVENGDVAIHAIPKGYYVIWKGDLYVSKTDISSGTTLGTSNLTAKPNGLGAEVAALNNNSTPVSISNQYSTVLAAINAYRTTKTYPFCIQKSGASAVTDLPSSFPTTCEWNVICIGDAQRTTAVLTIYAGGSTKNGWTYKANIFNGAIIRDWFSLDEDLNSKITEMTKNTINSTAVSLSYNVEYTAETDGYVRAIAPASGSLAVTINGLYIIQINNNECMPLYIRKGMKLKQITNDGGSAVFFKIE